MALGMRVIGLKTSNMDLVLRDGQMLLLMKVNTLKAKSTAGENSHGQMQALLLVISTITISMEMESTNGQMEESIQEIGKTIRWRAMVLLLGLTAENMWDNILMI